MLLFRFALVVSAYLIIYATFVFDRINVLCCLLRSLHSRWYQLVESRSIPDTRRPGCTGMDTTWRESPRETLPAWEGNRENRLISRTQRIFSHDVRGFLLVDVWLVNPLARTPSLCSWGANAVSPVSNNRGTESRKDASLPHSVPGEGHGLAMCLVMFLFPHSYRTRTGRRLHY